MSEEIKKCKNCGCSTNAKFCSTSCYLQFNDKPTPADKVEKCLKCGHKQSDMVHSTEAGNVGLRWHEFKPTPQSADKVEKCENCGKELKLWFDREVDENNSMNYRCETCGAIDGKKPIPQSAPI